jgi:hypothetical protein
MKGMKGVSHAKAKKPVLAGKLAKLALLDPKRLKGLLSLLFLTQRGLKGLFSLRNVCSSNIQFFGVLGSVGSVGPGGGRAVPPTRAPRLVGPHIMYEITIYIYIYIYIIYVCLLAL